MSRAEAYLELAFDYESAVTVYTAAVYCLLDATSSLEFSQAMKAVNLGHAKCMDFRMRLHELERK